jgi:GNAT acetyltransferase-like protein
VRLEAVGAAARDAWRGALAGDRHALVSQTPAWLDCVCAGGRWEDATRAYRALDGRALVLPLARLRGIPAVACVESSMPLGWSAGGLVCSEGRVCAADVRAIAGDLSASGALRIAVRTSPQAEHEWSAAVPARVTRTPYVEQRLDLSQGFDEIWAHRFSRRVRAWCRKAESRVTVEWDDRGRLVPVFDELYRKSVARWARQQHEPLALARWRARLRDPRRKFELVARHFGSACRVGVAWRRGEPAAALIVLEYGEQSKYWRGAMDRELSAGTGANELLHRMAIEHACETGRRFYDMGESRPQSSLARFKHGFGADDVSSSLYRFERLPLTQADERLRRLAKGILRFRD